jgi:hypothetical protein
MCCGGALLHVNDLAFELVARAEFHGYLFKMLRHCAAPMVGRGMDKIREEYPLRVNTGMQLQGKISFFRW